MIEVVAAVIVLEGKLLAFQRGPAKFDYVSFKFEFPGGKVEPGENLELALKRELVEELDLEGEVGELIATTSHDYSDFSIKMHCFLVRIDRYSGTLREHVDFAHIPLKDADSLDWIEADRPILELLKSKYSNVFV